jgi:L-ascorbate metabolism protein UlaG (beta-lactamase superfamily)
MKFTWYGQSTFFIEFGGKKLLIDPALSANPLAKDLKIDGLEVDYILISHGHEDHVADLEAVAKRTGAIIISNYEIVSYYGAKGYTGHPMNHGGKWDFDFGTVKYVNAVHSSVLPDGTYAGNPGGFVIWGEEGCFYFAGDTALTWDMKLIPMTCPKLDVAILPIGDNFTMGYEDARIASDFIECDKIIGCHYDSFPYIEIDHNKAKAYFTEKGKELILPSLEQGIEV